jgi:hypothetical protein
LGITSEAALTRLAFIIDFSLVTHHPSLTTFVKALTKGSTPKNLELDWGSRKSVSEKLPGLSPETGRSQRFNLVHF